MQSKKLLFTVAIVTGSFAVSLFVSSQHSIAQTAGQSDSRQDSVDQSVDAATIPSSSLDPQSVLATVNDQVITAGEVQHFLAERFKNLAAESRVAAVAQPEVQAQALQQLINRRIVFLKISDDGFAASNDAVQLEVDGFVRDLRKTGGTLEQWLDGSGLSREQFEFEVRWRLSWQVFLDRSLTDKFLEEHFERNRRKFDGTEMTVAHLLMKDSSPESMQSMSALRDQITGGGLAWADAVAEHSEAPSNTNAGEVGKIGIDGPMDPIFTAAAFRLQTGEISPVVQSRFGLHLIKCLEVHGGKNELRDVLDRVRSDAMEFGFNRIVESTRGSRTITFAGNWPRFDETGELIQPVENSGGR